MADWRKNFAKPTIAEGGPTQQEPANDWQFHYNILTNLTHQVGKNEEYLSALLSELGVKTMNGKPASENDLLTTTVFTEAKIAIGSIRKKLETEKMGVERLGELSDRADRCGKSKWILDRYLQLGITYAQDERGWYVEGLTADKYYLLHWEMNSFVEQKAPEKSTRKKNAAPKPAEVVLDAEEEAMQAFSKEFAKVKNEFVRQGLTGDEIQQIWESCEEQHEDLQAAVLEWKEKLGQAVDLANRPSEKPVDIQLPAEVERSSLIDEDGQVLDIEAYAEILDIRLPDNMRNPQELAEIQEEQAEWIVKRMRAAQHECEDLAFQALSKIKQKCVGMTGLMHHYGILLRNYAEPKLGRYTRGEKAGQLKEKNLKMNSGTVFFKKAGGVKLADPTEWQMFRESLMQEVVDGLRPAKDLDHFFIKLNVSYDYQRVRAAVKNGRTDFPGWTLEQEVETADMMIGGANGKGRQTPWSLKTLKTNMKDLLKAITVGGKKDDEPEDEGE